MSDAVSVAIIAAIVTAIVAGLGFWITYLTSTAAQSKVMALAAATKRVEFRQKWIDDLRNAVAAHLAHGSRLVHAQLQVITQEDYGRYVELTETIELLINHDEEASKKLLQALTEFADQATMGKAAKPGALYAARKAANEATRRILKAEWEKIKLELNAAKKGN